MRHEFAVEARMTHDAGPGHPSDPARGFEKRLPPIISVAIIAGLSAICWGALVGIVMALRALFCLF
jgi:hypothetical protein